VDELLTEKEQIEAVRSWWRENGSYIIGGIVIGVALLVGWNYWTNKREQTALEASAIYESLVGAVADGDADAARPIAANLYENYGSTVYAGQARLAMAKLYMDQGRDRDAAEELSAMLAEGKDSETHLLARLRLAKIRLYQDNPQEVLELLQGYRDTAFAARYNETLGDAYVALGQTEDAADAYAAALADDPNAPTVNRTLIQMKINDLPPSAAAERDSTANEQPVMDEEVDE
jgi:predicted negative regulator of RcsB-dependent stress response